MHKVAINVIGMGYIGLPTALSLACHGNKVIGTDCQKTVIENLKAGAVKFNELGMDELYLEAVEHDIEFTTDYVEADVYIIAVPTPYEKRNKKVDATYVINAVKSVLNVCLDESIIVIE